MTLPDCFGQFRESAFRLETLPCYTVPGEDERITAFREGRPLPERSPRTSPWLRRVARTTARGRRWSRIHVVDVPLSEYTRFELAAYRESAAAGEQVRITDRAGNPGLAGLQTDFWLFDAGTDTPFAEIMEYDSQGRYLGSRMTADVRECVAARDLASRYSVPLAAYLETAIA